MELEEKIDLIHKLLHKLIKIVSLTSKEVIDIEEASEFTSLKKSYIRKLNSLNKIPCYSYSENSKLYFKKSELTKWMTKYKRPYLDDLQNELINSIKKVV